jgi:hypothetical protein
MNALLLRQGLVIVLTLSLLLTVGTVGLGVGIVHGNVRAPNLDISFRDSRLSRIPLTRSNVSPPWNVGIVSILLCGLGVPPDRPNYVHLTWHRILSVPLQQ